MAIANRKLCASSFGLNKVILCLGTAFIMQEHMRQFHLFNEVITRRVMFCVSSLFKESILLSRSVPLKYNLIHFPLIKRLLIISLFVYVLFISHQIQCS